MSYIVPNSNKPVRCNRCPFIDADSLNCTLMEDSYKYIELAYQHIHCPLIEISRPHGRLGDLDKLIDSCKQYMNMLDPESKEYTKIFALKCYLVAVAEEAVIEAEGETE